MKRKIAILPGDGIGPEVMKQALRVLQYIANTFHHEFILKEALIGGAAFEEHEAHFPEATREVVSECDAILFGSVGGPVHLAHELKWRDCERNSLLSLRKSCSFHANFRPARVYPALLQNSPLRADIVKEGVDLLIVRELLGDIYFGTHETVVLEGRRVARDVAEYDEEQIKRIAVSAFQAARNRRGHVVSVDKANVLDTSKLWRTVVNEVHADYPEVKLEHMLVDNCAMQIIQNPGQFDVILTSNMFGDILSDAAAVLPGSLGLMPSASLSTTGLGMYEPSGGSAPDIAGKGVANPIAQILCVALLLRHSFGLEQEARLIEEGVELALERGVRTRDIAKRENSLSTEQATDAILQAITELSKSISQ